MEKYLIDELNLKSENIKYHNNSFLRDVAVFLDYLFKKGGIKIYNDLIQYSDLKQVAQNLVNNIEVKKNTKETNLEYIFVIDTICRIMGLSDIQAEVMFSKSSEIEQFNILSDKDKLDKCYKAYINNSSISEFILIPKLKIEWKDKEILKSILIEIRRSIDAILTDCVSGYWYSMSELVPMIYTENLFDNIESAKYGMMWIIYNKEECNRHIITRFLISTIFDIYFRYMGKVSTYVDTSNPLEELGLNISIPVMFSKT